MSNPEDQFKQFKLAPTSRNSWPGGPANTKRGISLEDVRDFLNDSYNINNSIGSSNISTASLFAVAQANNVNSAQYSTGQNITDFVAPHQFSEFRGLNYLNNIGPTLSLNGSASITIPRSWDNAIGYTMDVDGNGQSLRVAFLKPVWNIPNGYNCISWGNLNCFPQWGNDYLNKTMGVSIWVEDGRMLLQNYIPPTFSDYTSDFLWGPYGPQLYGGSPTYATGGWFKSGNNLVVHTREIWVWGGGTPSFQFPVCVDDPNSNYPLDPNGSGCSSTIYNYFSNVNNTGYWCNVDCNTDAPQQPYGGWQFRMQEVDINGNNIPSTSVPWLYDLFDVGSGAPYIYKDPGAIASDPEEGNLTQNIRTIVTFHDIHNLHGNGTSYNYIIHLHGWYYLKGFLYPSAIGTYTHYENRPISINFNVGHFGSNTLDATTPGRYEFEYTVEDYWGETKRITRNMYVSLT